MSALTARRKTQGAYADMGLTPVVGILESHWVVLEAELSEIKKDTAALRMLVRAARSKNPHRMSAEGARARGLSWLGWGKVGRLGAYRTVTTSELKEDGQHPRTVGVAAAVACRLSKEHR